MNTPQHDYSTFGTPPDVSRLSHTSDVLRLLLSVESFLERFGARPTVKTATDRAGSEFFEFVLALADAQLAMNSDEKRLTQEKAAEELVDLFYASYGAARRAGVTPAQVLAAWNAVITKNDSKTIETHAVNDHGSVERRVLRQPTDTEIEAAALRLQLKDANERIAGLNATIAALNGGAL